MINLIISELSIEFNNWHCLIFTPLSRIGSIHPFTCRSDNVHTMNTYLLHFLCRLQQLVSISTRTYAHIQLRNVIHIIDRLSALSITRAARVSENSSSYLATYYTAMIEFSSTTLHVTWEWEEKETEWRRKLPCNFITWNKVVRIEFQ